MPRRLDPEAAIGHLDRLYAAARALSGDPHLAEDLVQDTYAAVLSRPRFLSGSDELGYLLRALRNRWRDELRTRARRPQPLSLDDGGGEPLRATTPAPRCAPPAAVAARGRGRGAAARHDAGAARRARRPRGARRRPRAPQPVPRDARRHRRARPLLRRGRPGPGRADRHRDEPVAP